MRMKKLLLFCMLAFFSCQLITAQRLVSALTLYGNVVSDNSWTQGDHYGIYSIPVVSSTVPTLVHADSYFNFVGGGCYIPDENAFLGASFQSYENMVWGYGMRTFDPDTWKVKSQVNYYDIKFQAFAADYTYNPVDGKVYGLCYTSSTQDSVFLGTINYAEGTSKQIGKVLDRMFCAIAADSKGNVYGIDSKEGKLWKFDTTTGVPTEIGSTGIIPSGRQSATFDWGTKKLYWFAYSESANGLYEVNTTTGAATQIADWSASPKRVLAAYSLTPNCADSAPAACSSLTLDFDGTSLNGNVKFTLPSKTFSGSALSGNITYNIYVDGENVKKGSAEAGTEVSVPITVGNGTHTIAVQASNDSGNGPRLSKYKYFGFDVPLAPTNVKVKKQIEPEAVKVSWNKVNTGVKGGEIDTAHVTYDVLRLPDSVSIVKSIKDTVVTDSNFFENHKEYSYSVTANDSHNSSAATPSEKVKFDRPYTPPYKSTFDTDQNEGSLYTFENLNGDYTSWRYNSPYSSQYYSSIGSFQISYNYSGANDDWLYSPSINLEKGKLYTITYKIGSPAGYGNSKKHKFEISAGTSATSSAMTSSILAPVEVEGDTIYQTAYFAPSATGTYYLGMHSIAPEGCYSSLYVYALELSAGISSAVPDSATSISVVAGAGGAESATITFTASDKDAAGNDAKIPTGYIVRNITTGRNVRLGNNIRGFGPFSVSDMTPANDTINTYEVVFLNSEGAGLSRRASAFIGIDTPLSPDSVALKWSNGDAELKWKAPTKGVNGGYVNPDDLTYNIVLFENNNTAATYLNVKGTSYTDVTLKDVQNQFFAQYAVFAASKTGVSSGTRSNGRAFGRPYELPYAESLTANNAYPANMPWYSISNDSSDCHWGFNSTAWAPTYGPQDNDKGMILFIPGTKGTNFISGPIISLAESNKPVLRFWSNAGGNEAKLQISVEGGEYTDLLTIPTTAKSEWKSNSVDLSAYNGKHIQLGFLGKATGSDVQIGIDNITISEQLANDLAITKLTTEETSVAGDSVKVVVKIANNGSETAIGAKLAISVNGIESKIVDIPTVGSSGEASLDVYVPTTVADTLAVIKAEINFDADMLTDNNEATDTVKLIRRPWPVPSELAAKGNTISWKQPKLSTGPQAKTEDFESYDAWSIGGINTDNGISEGKFGYMKLYDGDGASTIAWEGFSSQPHAFEPMAYTIGRDRDDYNYLSYYGFSTHSGKQVLFSWSNAEYEDKSVDNWLILPLLSSNKKIDFYAKSMIAEKDSDLERFQILVSTTGDKISDFTAWSDTVSVPTRSTTSTEELFTHYEYTLPDNTNYVAIHHVKSTSAILIDDLTYYPAYLSQSDLNLIGYNVYRDGELLATVSNTTTSYTDNASTTGNHKYFVTALYSAGESSNSNIVEVDITTGINFKTADKLSASCDVYDLSGRLVKCNATDLSRLPRGVYIVNGKKFSVK